MLPKLSTFDDSLLNQDIPSKTKHIILEKDNVYGDIDGLDSVQQSIYLILNTERYDYPIFSWGYGVELKSLIGQPISYVIPEIRRRITEALLVDDRIVGVENFEFQVKKGVVNASWTTKTKYGTIDNELEVVV